MSPEKTYLISFSPSEAKNQRKIPPAGEMSAQQTKGGRGSPSELSLTEEGLNSYSQYNSVQDFSGSTVFPEEAR